MKLKKISLPIVIILGIVLDQIVKMAIVKNLRLSEQKSVINGILSLTHLRNNGAAWSILEGQQWFFVLTTVIVLAVAIWFWLKNLSKNWYAIGLTLIISGALGNFIDRVRQGYVVDMFQLDFINFPIFNVADILLSIGFVVLFIGILIEKDEG
ncbi:MAG: signal peptidase II [Lactococcus raffinolactis]|jgi:signal peptidase II|uniref:Lipoprotein signal peptidase n=1 Tax=Pseudolactococcus raffinolactis TaxID=1366 RepID=A0A290Q0V7_9LACT|nr:signal peptidase II [Lactococcus raffinolactis]MBR2541738.1 signal peptidase II [Lactococcus sp.]ATC62305.1 signal peptidase II [Lactococcus raffinolactis]MBW9297911.1 signal peptidase II [Lactococcus raffinolactis]MCH4162166.1 signal peptidase II [Lactococcus raffinolactis]MDN5413509.1 signal peptidase II [Lactococcus raffinolactis]